MADGGSRARTAKEQGRTMEHRQPGVPDDHGVHPPSAIRRPPSGAIRAVVFDLDGLMFDTEVLFHRVAGEMLAARGKVFTPEIMRAMIGRRAAEAGLAFKTLAGLDEPVEDLLAEVRARFQARADEAVHPTPG